MVRSRGIGMVVRGGKVGVWPLLVAWLIGATAYVAKAILTAASTPLILDTDDAMRLNEVHDFLAGQSWYDLVQHRLNTPYGAELHWSRLVDVPEAALILFLRPFAGGMTDTIAAYVWPLALLAALLWLSAKLALRLGGHEALWAALLLPIASLITMGEFAPGRFDHHSAQILCSLAMLYCTVAALERPRFALGAGIFAAVALTVGIEGLPMVAATVLVFGLMWVADRQHGAAIRDFGLAFAVAMSVGLAQGVAPERWFELRLDAISIVYVAAAVLGAVAFLALSLAPIARPVARLVTAVAAALVVGMLLFWLDPALLKGPYAALDPWLVQNWLAHVSESETWLQSLGEDPVYPLGVTVPVVAGLVYAVWNIDHQRDRPAGLIVAAVLIVGVAVMLIQIRAARIVTPLALPACAALVGTSWRRLLARPGFVRALGLVGSVVVSSGFAVAIFVALLPLPVGPGKGAAEREACLQPAAFRPLAAMPRQRVMAPVDLGSHLLLFTPHSVVGAPYHRNQEGLLDTFRFFDGAIAQARAILAARNISLVVVCPAMSELSGGIDRAPDSFATLYAGKSLPDWLIDETPAGAVLKLYAVKAR